MIKMDAEFNRIVMCDVKNDISRAFNSLEYETRRGLLSERCQHPEIIKKFTRAIQKGLDYVHERSDEEVANAILDFFPDTSLNDLAGVVKRYRSIDAWPTTTEFSSESFYHLQEIMQAANELDNTVSYEDLIYTKD